MAIFTVKIETANRRGETLVLTFTNRKAMQDFYYNAMDRSDVISLTADHFGIKSFAKADAATQSLNDWAA